MKQKVAIIFGGRSAEHEVSVRSARNVLAALDKSKFEPVLLGIDRAGQWHLTEPDKLLLPDAIQEVGQQSTGKEVILTSTPEGPALVSQKMPTAKVDVVFPVLHGPYGEDGTIQGLFKLAGIPFVGPSVLGSSVGMDKDAMKRLLRDAAIPIGKFVTVHAHQKSKVNPEDIIRELGTPVFVKPANMGSSVGVQKADTSAALRAAMDHAFEFDRKIVIEQFIKGREIECAVLGNEFPEASIPGEIVTGGQHEFYSYSAKYVDCEGQKIIIPAELSPAVVRKIQDLSIQTFQVLCCEGMSRVDFFLTAEEEIFVNEINTIPGFTSISMYPMLWEASGVPYSELITRLIALAADRFEKEQMLKVKPGE